jgi:hypothetical protein
MITQQFYIFIDTVHTCKISESTFLTKYPDIKRIWKIGYIKCCSEENRRGRVIAQAVSRRVPTAAARVQSQVR